MFVNSFLGVGRLGSWEVFQGFCPTEFFKHAQYGERVGCCHPPLKEVVDYLRLESGRSGYTVWAGGLQLFWCIPQSDSHSTFVLNSLSFPQFQSQSCHRPPPAGNFNYNPRQSKWEEQGSLGYFFNTERGKGGNPWYS